MSNCCNNNCRQVGFNWPLIGVVAACFVFWGVVIAVVRAVL